MCRITSRYLYLAEQYCDVTLCVFRNLRARILTNESNCCDHLIFPDQSEPLIKSKVDLAQLEQSGLSILVCRPYFFGGKLRLVSFRASLMIFRHY